MKVELIDHMGTDLSVVNAAKVSFDKRSEWDDTRYPEYWEVGMEVEYVRNDDWGPSKGDRGVIQSISDNYTGRNRRPAKEYQVFFVAVGNDPLWTTPTDVKLVGGQAKVLSQTDTKLIHYLARGMSSKDHEKIVQEALEAETREVLLDCFARLNVDTHWTPFAHTAISLRMSAPLPIRTQCFKHKQGLVENEESRRYISSTPTLFVPKEFRSAPTGGAKQGSSGVHPDSAYWQRTYTVMCDKMIHLYEEMVAEGVCPEQARFVLPQGCEVQWIWTGNLYAFANFCNKRTDAHAQKEIQELARMVGGIIEPLFPVSWRALVNDA